MVFCLHDIRQIKLNNSKIEDSIEGKICMKFAFLKQIKSWINWKLNSMVFYLKVKFLNFDPSHHSTTQMSGYYYDYKYGAGGFYLKTGLACI